MDASQFTKQMEHIFRCIKQAGYDPYDQLVGYIKTDNEIYITRTGDARAMIKKLDKAQISEYLRQLKRDNL